MRRPGELPLAITIAAVAFFNFDMGADIIAFAEDAKLREIGHANLMLAVRIVVEQLLGLNHRRGRAGLFDHFVAVPGPNFSARVSQSI